MKTIIYVLRLTNDKFYVSSTYNIYSTLKNVFSKNKDKDIWLKKNEPMYVDKVVHNCSPDEEYKYLLKYIREYGVDNVRGPTFDSFTYEQESLREIKESIKRLMSIKTNVY